MDSPVAEAILLMVAGIAMGFVNNLAGAGGLIGLAALDLVSGLGSATVANASLRPAAVGVTVAGVFGFLSKGRTIPRRAWAWGLATVPGAVGGAYLVVGLPPWAYRGVLIAVVSLLIVQQLLPRKPRTEDRAPVAQRSLVGTMVLFTLVGLHMGFLQVAAGLLSMLAIGHALRDPKASADLVQVNTAKVAMLSVASITSTCCLATTGAIAWRPAVWLAVGAAIGSFAAGRWSVRKGHGAIRIVVLAVCALVLLRLFLTG